MPWVENFFSILKTECIYCLIFSEANVMIDHHICFYNHERIQLKTGKAPLPRRLSAYRLANEVELIIIR